MLVFSLGAATLPKPIELKFNRGNDGGAYVVFVPTCEEPMRCLRRARESSTSREKDELPSALWLTHIGSVRMNSSSASLITCCTGCRLRAQWTDRF